MLKSINPFSSQPLKNYFPCFLSFQRENKILFRKIAYWQLWKRVTKQKLNPLPHLVLISILGIACAKANPPQPEELYEFGVRVHAMVKAYQPDGDKSNIFIPLVRLPKSEQWSYLKWKGKICIFASGGIGNAWEKTVSKAYSSLYGHDIKIIRASWVRKHVQQDLEEEYKERPQDLHAELFFMLFVGKFKKDISAVKAFSWWCPCDKCRDRMVGFKGKGQPVYCEISYARPYEHTYHPSNFFSFGEIDNRPEREERVWRDIWQRIMTNVDRPFKDPEKKDFWSKDYVGICLSKWLAEVFVDERDEDEAEEGDESRVSVRLPSLNLQKISPFLKDVDKDEQKRLLALVRYLREVNWEFSCWYKKPFPCPIQPKWNRHWQSAVLPHFEWEIVDQIRDEDGEQQCEMCGHEGIKELHYAYHAKHTPSRKPGITKEYKKRKSLTVGSECVKYLSLTKEVVEEAVEDAQQKYREQKPKRKAAKFFEQQAQELEEAEKKIKQQEREARQLAKEERQRQKEERDRLKEQQKRKREEEHSERKRAKKNFPRD